jgi:Putative prokaryotic signal transducing protein
MADLLHPSGTDDDENVRESPQDPGEFEVAGSVPDSFEADLLSRALEEAGIPSIVHSPHSGVAGKIDSPVEVYNLLVPARDANRARLILAERRAALEADPEGASRAAEDAEEAEAADGHGTE